MDNVNQRKADLEGQTLSRLVQAQAVLEGDLNLSSELILKAASEVMNVARASLWFLSENTDQLECYKLYKQPSKEFSSNVILLQNNYPNYFKSIIKNHWVAADLAQTDPQTNEFTDGYLKPLGITSMLDAGLILEGSLKGVICIEHVGEPRQWQPYEKVFVSTLASLFSQVLLTNERIKKTIELEKAVKQKNIFLKELHHRVKNNLQLIISIIKIDQYPKGTDFSNSDRLKVINRIRAMAAVHNEVYSSENIHTLYLNDLIADIVKSLKPLLGLKKNIELVFNHSKANIEIPIEKAIPISLILNELISNSYNHAFDNISEGKIIVDASIRNNNYCLTVSDSGIGFEYDSEINSTGYKIIRALVDQIDGRLKITLDSGSIIEICFP